MHPKFTGLKGELAFNHALAKYTSWHVGGPADLFFRPQNRADLLNFLQQLPAEVPLTWLGLGSNTLIRDGGIRGAVVLTLNRLQCMEEREQQRVFVESGVPCAKLAKFCAKNGYEDGAFFCGIPGTVGGALFMNAGAFGGETWPHVLYVTTVDRFGQCYEREVSSFNYGYRHITNLGGQYFLDATQQFTAGDAVAAKQKIKDLLQQRGQTQPIGAFSCGSTFTNPTNDHAGRLIEAVGLKGYRLGGAVVSTKHANFLVNEGGATSHDMEALTRLIQDTVFEQYGVKLTPEYCVLGEDA